VPHAHCPWDHTTHAGRPCSASPVWNDQACNHRERPVHHEPLEGSEGNTGRTGLEPRRHRRSANIELVEHAPDAWAGAHLGFPLRMRRKRRGQGLLHTPASGPCCRDEMAKWAANFRGRAALLTEHGPRFSGQGHRSYLPCLMLALANVFGAESRAPLRRSPAPRVCWAVPDYSFRTPSEQPTTASPVRWRQPGTGLPARPTDAVAGSASDNRRATSQARQLGRAEQA